MRSPFPLALSAVATNPRRGVALRLAVNVNTTSGTPLDVPWDTEDEDTSNFWAIGNPTQIVVPTGLDGLYLIVATGHWNTSTVNARELLILRNGTTIGGSTIRPPQAPGSTNARTNARALSVLAAGDVIKANVLQDSGVTPLVIAGNCRLAAYRIAA